MKNEIKPADQSLSPKVVWDLVLFVAGNDGTVQLVRRRLEKICNQHLKDHCLIDVVDIIEQPEKADEFDIIATPALLRRHPKPMRRVIGDLSLTHKVLAGIGLPPIESDG